MGWRNSTLPLPPSFFVPPLLTVLILSFVDPALVVVVVAGYVGFSQDSFHHSISRSAFYEFHAHPQGKLRGGMDNMSTPGLEHDPPNGPSSLFSGSSDSIPASSSSDAQSQCGGQQGTQSQSSGQKFSNGPHIRSRITVVCAECKRLKLKCDRRTPCSSCLKRDTVQRCVYSQAAAEKIDVQSLHNRILVIEGHLAQISASSPTSAPSLPPFRSSYPGSTPPQSMFATTSQNGSSLSTRPHAGSALGLSPSNDRAMLVTGSSGSSVVVSLDDTASIWLNEIESPTSPDELASSVPPYSATRPGAANGAVRVKLEPTPVLLSSNTIQVPPPSVPAGSSSSVLDTTIGHNPEFVPPLPITAFLPTSSRVGASSSYGPPSAPQAFTSTFPSVPDSTSAPLRSTDSPQVTPILLRNLPSTPSIRSRYLQSLAELMLIHPCFNVRHFERRVDAMLAWSEANEGTTSAKRDLAREVFFGASSTNSTKKTSSGAGKDRNGVSSPKPTLSFFSAACAAFALGALMTRDGTGDVSATDEEAARRNSPAALFALSEQALGLFEKTSAYDVDSVIAMLLQILFLLHDGQMRVAQGVFPLVGKIINVARMMGLAMDPDEFVGAYTLFEAETRRRVWWDVLYYDLLVSECMGQQPLIAEGSFTTKLPADADEDKFSPSSTTIPAPPTEDGEPVPTYMVMKCRLAQLLKSVKRQVTKDAMSEEVLEVSLDQAASCETEIFSWMSELPAAYRLNMELDTAHPLSSCVSTSPFQLAQCCELVITANRMVLKLYLPFMKEPGTSGTSKPSHQALMGTINAAHAIIYASRVLHSLWRDTRPAAFDFYDYGRSLFDAAVLCAHAVIQQPKSILAAEAMKGVSGALDVMRAVDSSKAGTDTSRPSSEAVKIVELMKEKAERARSPDAATAGTKRKRHDSSTQRDRPLAGGFQLPFVGPSVSSTRPEQPRSAPLAMSKIASSAAKKDSQCSPPESKSMKSSKEKEKTPKYPSVGFRVRSPQSSPTSQSTSTASPQVPPSASGMSATTVRSPTSTPDRSNQPSIMRSHSSVMYSFPSSHPAPSSHPVQSSQPQQEVSPSSLTHDYRMDYSGAAAADDNDRRYQSTFSNSSSSSTYDAPAPHTPYDTSPHASDSYRPSAPSQEYYMTTFASVPTGYDQSGMNQTQNMSVPTYGVHSPLDTAMTPGLTSSIPSTPRDPYHLMSSDKAMPHYNHQHVGKSELERQISHEYQQTATSHGMAITATPLTAPYVQGWQPEMTRQNWDYQKYYNHQA